MSVKSGTYKISSATGHLAGRGKVEDKSLGPKEVLCHTDMDDKDAVWRVQQLAEHRYKLFISGAPAGNLEGKVYAFLRSGVNEEILEWNITPHQQYKGLCTVTTVSDHRSGWVEPRHDDETKTIDVAPLVFGHHEPPHYPKTELWRFERLD